MIDQNVKREEQRELKKTLSEVNQKKGHGKDF